MSDKRNKSSLERAIKGVSVAIITGGSSGIGRELLAMLADAPGIQRLYNVSRREVAGLSGEHKIRNLSADLTESSALINTFSIIEHEIRSEVPSGKLLLINNSGFGSYGAFLDQELTRQLAMIDLNVRAVVDITRRMLPLMLERGGSLVTIASTAAFQPTPTLATYGATKAFVQSWTLALADELRQTPVSVLCVCPGPTQTSFFRASGFGNQTLPGLMPARAVALKTFEALASGRTLIVTGFHNRLLTLASSFLPRSIMARLAGISLRNFRKFSQP